MVTGFVIITTVTQKDSDPLTSVIITMIVYIYNRLMDAQSIHMITSRQHSIDLTYKHKLLIQFI